MKISHNDDYHTPKLKNLPSVMVHWYWPNEAQILSNVKKMFK